MQRREQCLDSQRGDHLVTIRKIDRRHQNLQVPVSHTRTNPHPIEYSFSKKTTTKSAMPGNFLLPKFYTGFLHAVSWLLYYTSFYYISLGVSFGAGIGRITNS